MFGPQFLRKENKLVSSDDFWLGGAVLFAIFIHRINNLLRSDWYPLGAKLMDDICAMMGGGY